MFTITPNLVYNVIRNMKNSYSNGSNDLPVFLLKKSNHIISLPLSIILQSLFSSSSFPEIWKTSNIVPIPKCKNPSISDLRPISILPGLSKIYEKCILFYMARSLYTMYDKNQYGFLPNSSTACSTISLLHYVQSTINAHQKREIYILNLDISKAFDNVNHDLLLQILSTKNLNPNFICLFKNYLCNRYQTVKLGSVISPRIPVSSGVPQGSILGPILFNIYVSSLGPSKENIKCLKYADDTSFVFSVGPSESYHDIICAEIDHVKSWCIKFNMLLNETKTKILPISSTIPKNLIKSLDNNLQCYFVDNISFLGYTINRNLKWSDHINKMVKTISSRLHILRMVKNMLSKKHLIIIYIGLIQSIFDYSFPIHSYFTTKDIKRLNSLRRRAHNIICDQHCHLDCLPILSDKWNKLSQNLFIKINSNTSHVLHDCLLPKSYLSGRFLLPVINSNGLLNSFIIKNSILFNQGRVA
jgi:retron-type reverse transcriptase